jgi:hypothetical protein
MSVRIVSDETFNPVVGLKIKIEVSLGRANNGEKSVSSQCAALLLTKTA